MGFISAKQTESIMTIAAAAIELSTFKLGHKLIQTTTIS